MLLSDTNIFIPSGFWKEIFNEIFLFLSIFYIQDAKRTEEHNVVILVDFAIALMQTLDTINRESFQRFRLRMGLNHGPVIAGVIGTCKFEELNFHPNLI